MNFLTRHLNLGGRFVDAILIVILSFLCAFALAPEVEAQFGGDPEPIHPYLNDQTNPRVMAWECGFGGSCGAADLEAAINRWLEAVCGSAPCEGFIQVGIPQDNWHDVGIYVEYRFRWRSDGPSMLNLGYPTGTTGLYNHMGCFLDITCGIQPLGS